jgi:D-alanyl-D-alanine carboxypeptidase
MRSGVTVADGVVPDGVTVFDDEIPALANLDPDLLLDALRHAATNAADDGVEFVVTSGWRSPEFQEELLREAVSQYGSERKLPDGWPALTRLLALAALRSPHP